MFKKAGDWKGARRAVWELDVAFQKMARVYLLKVGQKARQIARDHIQNLDLLWDPLAESTTERKAYSPYPDDILREYGDYYRAITFGVNKSTVHIGVKKGAVNRNGDDLELIALSHEYGVPSRGLVARPLWQPSGEDLMKWLERNDDPVSIFVNLYRKK